MITTKKFYVYKSWDRGLGRVLEEAIFAAEVLL